MLAEVRCGRGKMLSEDVNFKKKKQAAVLSTMKAPL